MWARDNNQWPNIFFCEKKIKLKDKNGKNVLLQKEYHQDIFHSFNEAIIQCHILDVFKNTFLSSSNFIICQEKRVNFHTHNCTNFFNYAKLPARQNYHLSSTSRHIVRKQPYFFKDTIQYTGPDFPVSFRAYSYVLLDNRNGKHSYYLIP